MRQLCNCSSYCCYCLGCSKECGVASASQGPTTIQTASAQGEWLWLWLVVVLLQGVEERLSAWQTTIQRLIETYQGRVEGLRPIKVVWRVEDSNGPLEHPCSRHCALVVLGPQAAT